MIHAEGKDVMVDHRNVIHVVDSLSAPVVQRIVASLDVEDREGHTTVCTIQSLRPRRRRRSVAEIMTINDNVFDTDPNALVNELARLDDQVTIDRMRLKKILCDHGIDVMSAEQRHRFDVTISMRLRRLCRRRNPHLIKTWDPTAHRWAQLAASRMQISVLAARPDRATTPDTGLVRFDEPHHMTRQQFLDSLHLPANATLVGTTGPMLAHRRIKDLIWATELLRLVHDDTYLLIGGSGPEEWRLHRFRDQVGVRYLVRFLGSHRDHRRWIPHLDFYWSASKQHDDPTFVFDAMAAGVPVIATDISDYQQVITSGQNGYLVQPCDRAAFARDTWRMINDKALASRIGEAGRDSILKASQLA